MNTNDKPHAEQTKANLYHTQVLNDLNPALDGETSIAFYGRTPHRIEFNEKPDGSGLYRTTAVTYVADPQAPFIIRGLNRYGEVFLCAYQYVQFEGFKSINIPEGFKTCATEELQASLITMADYLHDLLMFHRIDPPSCNYIPAETR